MYSLINKIQVSGGGDLTICEWLVCLHFIFSLSYMKPRTGNHGIHVPVCSNRQWLCPWQDYRNWAGTCLPAHLPQERSRENGEGKHWEQSRVATYVWRRHGSTRGFASQPKERWSADRYPLPAVTPRLCALKVSFLVHIKRARGAGKSAPTLVPPCCKTPHWPSPNTLPGFPRFPTFSRDNIIHCELKYKVHAPTQGSHAGTYHSSCSLKWTGAKQWGPEEKWSQQKSRHSWDAPSSWVNPSPKCWRSFQRPGAC